MHVGPLQIANNTWRFTVWAPLHKQVALEMVRADGQEISLQNSLAMTPHDHGYHIVEVENLSPGQLYRYNLDEQLTRPDQASHHQPLDVHGPSALVDHASFAWQHEAFHPPPLAQLIIYELHIGAFTPEGTFDAAIQRLDHLADLGVNAVEVMPLAQFPGSRNWGYDGVHPFAVQHSYGGPKGFKRFVDACHGKGLAVILDVVYNHLGPEGNYTRDFAPYFTSNYSTPWGEAVNFDGAHSDGVRNHFIQNALHWYRNYNVDGLRLDATQAIFDERPVHVLEELAAATRAFENARGRQVLLIAESDRNDPRLVLPRSLGGYGLDAVWSDDFHHSVHALLTKERRGYYQDYGSLEWLAKSLRHGFAYQGEYSAFRKHSHGRDASLLPRQAHVFCIQNHDQVGNRMLGDRFGSLLDFEAQKLAASLLLFAPCTPLLFMGEEYGETAPFQYFISHLDEKLVDAVRKGRKREFKAFKWKGEPPDPQAPETFQRSKLDWDKLEIPRHRQMLAFYRECLRLRREIKALTLASKTNTLVWASRQTATLAMRRCHEGEYVLLLCNLHPEKMRDIDMRLFNGPGNWTKLLESSDTAWHGPGAALPENAKAAVRLLPYAAALYHAKE